MSLRRFILIILLACGANRAIAMDVNFTSIPSSAGVGQSYYVEATANAGWYGAYIDMWLHKNGGYIGTIEYIDSSSSKISETTTDYSLQTVEYFAEAMEITYSDYGYNYAWVDITPASTSFSFSNLSQTYDGSSKTASVSPTPSGATYTSDLTKGPGAGSYTVSATAYGNYTGSGSDTLTIGKAGQSISFSQPGTQTCGGSFGPEATASSGLTVSYSVTSGSASVSGSTIYLTGAGSVTVRASQGGDSNYNAASDVDRTFSVNKGDQTITFTQPGTQTFGTPLNPGATASSGLTVSYSVTSGSASVSGSTINFTGVGSVTVRAAQSGDANFNAASNVDRTFSVSKATPTGTFNNRTLVAQTATTYTVQAGDLNASFAGPSGATAPTGTVTYSIVGPGTTITAGSTLSVTTYTIRASYPGDSNYNSTTKDATWTVLNDSDSDGIYDYIESQLGTNPNAAKQNDSSNAGQLKVHRPQQP